MRQNLLETYSRQLKVAEAYVAKNFEGKTMSSNTALTTAVLLDNTNRWITESFNMNMSPAAATNRADLGNWKKFCLNLTNIAVPSLIANDLVIVHPMTSYSGSVAYLKYVTLDEKHGVGRGETLNSVFGLGEMTDGRMQYTSQIVIEESKSPTLDVAPIKRFYDKENDTYKTIKVINEDGSVVFVDEVNEIPDTAKKIAYVVMESIMESTPSVPGTGTDGRMNYPQTPRIGPKMEHIPLIAEPRRIAVQYDQITAFQAKTDYGFSLDKQIAEQACGELAYEIDTEIVAMLKEGAEKGTSADERAALTWSKTLPVGVSKFEHYNGFLEVVEMAKAIIYQRTQKFHPNYMVIASNVLPVLRFINGFTASKNTKMNGPYKVGELDGMNIFVSPLLKDGEFFLGLNGNDMMSSAGVYAPYMAIVPTQLLGTPDGSLTQGFSTWYAKALLNESLLVAGQIVD